MPVRVIGMIGVEPPKGTTLHVIGGGVSVPFLKDPSRIDVTQLTPELAEAALEASFEKYFYMGSLLGSYDKCLATVDHLAKLDVDEVACLVDFGVEPAVVMKGLENLNVLRKLANPEPLRAA